MVVLIVGMLLCLGLAVAVVGVVAVPARRQGRDILTPRGEEVVAQVKEATGTAVEKATEVTQAAVEKTGEALSSAKDKVTESTSSKTPE